MHSMEKNCTRETLNLIVQVTRRGINKKGRAEAIWVGLLEEAGLGSPLPDFFSKQREFLVRNQIIKTNSPFPSRRCGRQNNAPTRKVLILSTHGYMSLTGQKGLRRWD